MTIPAPSHRNRHEDETARPCVRGCVRPRAHRDDCADRGCRGCAPRPATNGFLCWSCHRRLELMLTDIPGIADWLDAHIRAGSRPRGDLPTRRTKGEPPIPIDLDVLDHGLTITCVVLGWCEVLVEKTSLTGPRQWTVPATAAYLRTHLTAVEAADWCAVAWQELADATSQAHALAPWRPELRRCDGIPCPECQAMALVVYGGDEDVTCQECRVMIQAKRYTIWTRMLVDEAAAP